MKNENIYIVGRNAVLEAIAADEGIEKIYIRYGSHGDVISKIFSQAKKAHISCVESDKRKFEELENKVLTAGEGVKTQGVIALRKQFRSFSLMELIENCRDVSDFPVILILDGITDPHNLGAIARSALCAGCAGIVLPERNSATINPTAIKASAGALEYIPVVKVSSIVTALTQLKEAGFWIFGTEADGDHIFYEDHIYDCPTAMIVGGEGVGMRPSTRKHCDFTIRIPISSHINSLNASVAAGIVLFEIVRQRLVL